MLWYFFRGLIMTIYVFVFVNNRPVVLKICPYTLKIFAKVYVRTFWYVAFHIFQSLYCGNQRAFYSNGVSSCYFSISQIRIEEQLHYFKTILPNIIHQIVL